MNRRSETQPGDFAVVDIHESSVLLEANEWDSRIHAHWAVTLYLDPAQALQLAEELKLCAVCMQNEART